MTKEVHERCAELALDALERLQTKKKGSLTSAVRMLELCATLLGDSRLLSWCRFQLGSFQFRVKPYSKGDQRDANQCLDELKKELDDEGISIPFEEQVPRVSGEAGGGFKSIEFIEDKYYQILSLKEGNDGTYYLTNLLETMAQVANGVSRQASAVYASLAFSSVPETHFGVVRDRVDAKLRQLCPTALEQFVKAYQMLKSPSGEDWSLALTECRRILKGVADAISPAASDNPGLTDDKYLNRLLFFVDQHAAGHGSDRELTKAHIDYLESFLKKLNDVASKGVHSTVKREEAVRAVLYTYLTLGDILDYASDQSPQASQPSIRKATTTKKATKQKVKKQAF